MTRKLDRTQIAEVARIVAPAPKHTTVPHPPRSFELPLELYVATVAGYLIFIALLVTAFANEEMILPAAIFVVFVAAGFGVPALWTRIGDAHSDRAMSWAQFRRMGIRTHTGPMNARDATIQVLILPALIVCWGLAVAAIVALG